MLAVVLFGVIFTTGIWIAYALHYITNSLSGISFLDAGLTNVLLYVLFVCLPIFILWSVFGYVSQFLYNRTYSRQLFRLFSQQKKTMDYSDLLARIMLETEQNIKSAFMLNRFDLLVADMNELLSEFLQRERLVSSEQIEHLWIKVQNGGKWSFGKVLIENYNRQPSFQKRIFSDAMSDSILSGTIMEFCARYQTLLSILEKHDKEKIFLNIIETGVFGKVFAILAPLADELRRSKDSISSIETKTQSKFFASAKTEESLKKSEKKSFFERLKSSKESKPVQKQEKDAFSLALERSFGEDEIKEKNEPMFDSREETISSSPQRQLSISTEETEFSTEVTDTQKALDSLKEEWKEMGDSSDKKEQNDEELTYPFGGWTDADNYQK